jgi:cyclopropane-fatty-acyl-phospholipid synthase
VIAPGAVDTRAADVTREILGRLFGDGPRGFIVRLWDGTVWPDGQGEVEFVLSLTHPGALRRMLGFPLDLAIGESFVRGDFEVDGNLEAALRAAEGLAGLSARSRDHLALAGLVSRLPHATGPEAPGSPRAARLRGARHSRERDRQAITHHYDVGNDFFRLWLDRRLVYSCAYFPRGDEDLDAAQDAKLDLICRKLRLSPGERLLDIGCGWGGLVQFAAERYGVTALGITLSEPQADLASRRIAEAGLQERCRVEVRDYRDQPSEPFDKVASIGMFEHVGRARLPEYFAAAWAALRPGGLFLNHGIATGGGVGRGRSEGRPSFIDRYVFPDGELVSIADALRVVEQAGFEVRDVESLREHYALTLRHWVRRLEAHHAEAAAAASEAVYRTWRLFMAASAYGFATGRLNVYQALLAKPDEHGRTDLPLSRADIYSPAFGR